MRADMLSTHSREERTMEHSTIRLTMAQAVVQWLCAQMTEIDGQRVPLFAGVFGIFSHGNVTCLSEALEACRTSFPPGAGRTNSRWRWLPSGSPRPSGGGRS
jgi:hypothetical protein